MTIRSPSASAAVLAVLSVAQFLIALDYSIIYVALPSVAADLHVTSALAQWIVSAYAIPFAGFLIVGGRLSDRTGPKHLFIVSIIGFGIASAIGGAAGNGAVLLAARGAQGLSAALLQPAVLGLIGTTFPAGPSRSRALAVWGSVGALGLAAGVLLGGLLTTVSWRLVFVVNVPLTLMCAAGAAICVAAARDRTGASRVPLLAAVLGTGGMLALVLGLTLASELGWGSAATLSCLGLAVAGLIAFIRNERSLRNVLIAPVLRSTYSLRIGGAATALYMASVGSEFFLLTLLLQSVKGYSPLRAGLAFLPLALMVTAGSTTAGRAVRRFSPATVLVGGFTIAVAGLVWLTFTLSGNSYLTDFLPGLLLSGFGHGTIYTSMFIVGTRDVPAEHQGTAGGLLTTSQYLSGAFTLAILTIALGQAPGNASFRLAFAIITAAAAAGIVLVASQHRRLSIVGPAAKDAGKISART